MIIDTISALCRKWPGVTEDIKWDNDLVFSVGGKMFVVQMLDPPHRLSFKVDDEEFADLVEREGIIPAPYLARAKWISLESVDAMDQGEVRERVRRAYDLVKAKLTRRAQEAIDGTPARQAKAKPPRKAARR